MLPKTCVNCGELKRCQESRVSWVFFIIGMISTISVRVVTVLTQLDPMYGKAAWYLGVCGFFIFFMYKFKVDKARYRLILQHQLMNKIESDEKITLEDRRHISSILCATSSNKDRINYFFIFITSALAIAAAIYFDFIK